MEPEAIEEFLKKHDWKYFEDFVSKIFENHGYTTIKHFRFKGIRRGEIDVLAWNETKIFIVECKRWKKHRPKSYQLKQAAKKVLEYLKDFKAVYSKNTYASFGELKKKEIVPIIVTLYEETLRVFEGVIIIPLWKLNSFLLNIDEILDTLSYNK